MKKLLLVLAFLCAPAAYAQTGWTSFPNTNLSAICPSFTGQVGTCSSVVAAWGGGLYDSQRSRMIIWGGGHTDYNGNEIYALDFSNPAVPARVLVTNPTSGSNLVYPACNNGSNNDGTPTSRHSYGGSTYFPTQDEYFFFGGGCGNVGNFQDDVWTFNPNTSVWTKFLPATHPNTSTDGTTPIMAYDSVTDAGYFMEFNAPGVFWRWNPTTHTWTNLTTISGAPCTGSPVGGGGSGTANNSIVDPGRRLYVCAGNGNLQAINLSTFAVQNDSSASGCSAIANGPAPGLAYDPVQKLVIAWVGGNSIIQYNPTTRSCSTLTFSGGPGAQQAIGTYNRFQYSPNLCAFILVNDMTQNVFTLRLLSQVACAAQDWTNRSTAAGVVRTEAWDNASDFTPASGGQGVASGLYPAEDNCAGTCGAAVYQGTQDTTTAMSGSSLKFTIRAGSIHPVGTNPSGYWLHQLQTEGATSSAFGENSDLYFQFSYRLDPNMISYNWGSNIGGQGWKVFIVWGPVPGQSCTNDQFVQENTNQKNILTGYVSCGSPSLVDNNNNTPFNWEQASGPNPPNFICPRVSSNDNYSQPPFNTECSLYPVNTWITENWHVHIGTWAGGNSTFDAFVSVNGQPMRQWLHLPNFQNGAGGWGGGDLPGGGTNHAITLQGIIFQPYFSSSLGTNTTSPASAMWFDEFVVSTQPIVGPQAPAIAGANPPPLGISGAGTIQGAGVVHN